MRTEVHDRCHAENQLVIPKNAARLQAKYGQTVASHQVNFPTDDEMDRIEALPILDYVVSGPCQLALIHVDHELVSKSVLTLEKCMLKLP